MHLNYVIVAAVVGFILSIGSLVPYVLDIFRHKTKPERAMWWIYSGLFALLFAAQANAGAKWLLIISGEYIFSSVVIAILSLKYGFGSFHKRDSVSIAIALAGFALWIVTDRPLIAILSVVVIDFAGFWLTLTKTWHAPHSETLISWQLSLVAAVLSVFTLSTWTFTLVVYPLYAIVGTAMLVWLIMYRRTKVKVDPVDF